MCLFVVWDVRVESEIVWGAGKYLPKVQSILIIDGPGPGDTWRLHTTTVTTKQYLLTWDFSPTNGLFRKVADYILTAVWLPCAI